MEIRQVDFEHIADAATVIRQSFGTVADEFGLTPENCPTHPAFLTEKQLRAHVADGMQLFAYYASEALVGVVGVKQVNGREFEIERLAVLPDYRHRSFGAKLMVFACEKIVGEGGEKACIGIIDENASLKQWYERQGFVSSDIKRFPHLPFTVCLMEKVLNLPTVDDTD